MFYIGVLLIRLFTLFPPKIVGVNLFLGGWLGRLWLGLLRDLLDLYFGGDTKETIYKLTYRMNRLLIFITITTKVFGF